MLHSVSQSVCDFNKIWKEGKGTESRESLWNSWNRGARKRNENKIISKSGEAIPGVDKDEEQSPTNLSVTIATREPTSPAMC